LAPATGGKKNAAPLYHLAKGLMLLLLAGGPAVVSQAAPAALSLPLAGRVIVVDAGHGGPDPGAVSATGLQEKDVALAIARYLAAELRKAGAKAVLTRDGDYCLRDESESLLTGRRKELAHRVAIAERNRADILVSIHLNAFPGTGEYGSQTFSQRGDRAGARLARDIQAELNRILQNSGREALEGDFYLTRTAARPAVIVEAGFLSNAREAQLLSDPAYQACLAFAIASGIARYFAGEEKAPGAQVGTGKVGIGQAVQDDTLPGAGVDEAAVPRVYPHVGGIRGIAQGEKQQIPFLQMIPVHGPPGQELQVRIAGNRNSVNQVGNVRQPGTIDAPGRHASPEVGSAG